MLRGVLGEGEGSHPSLSPKRNSERGDAFVPAVFAPAGRCGGTGGLQGAGSSAGAPNGAPNALIKTRGARGWRCEETKASLLIIQTVLSSLLPGVLASGCKEGGNGGRAKEEMSAGCA